MRYSKYTLEERKISDTYSSIKQRTKNDDFPIEKTWEREDFIQWYLKQKKGDDYVCNYCGSKEKNLNILNKIITNKRSYTRGNTLEVDRFKDDKGYTEENCCLACYWCNNAKTDTFSKEDMQIIGKAIGEVLEDKIKRLIFEK